MRPRVLVVYKKSTYQRYVSGDKSRLQELIDHGDVSVEGLVNEHEVHQETVRRAKKALRDLGPIDFVTQDVSTSEDTITVNSLAVPGETDLVFFEHVLGVDASAERISFEPTSVQQGDDYTLSATVKNSGDFVIPSLNLDVYDGDALIHSQTLSNLASGEEATVEVQGTMSDEALQSFRLVVDPAGDLDEKDEDNNELVRELVGPTFDVFFRSGFQLE